MKSLDLDLTSKPKGAEDDSDSSDDDDFVEVEEKNDYEEAVVEEPGESLLGTYHVQLLSTHSTNNHFFRDSVLSLNKLKRYNPVT